ncbi:MAG: HupE/UreJ family protein, partial [Myxococcota bacterium]
MIRRAPRALLVCAVLLLATSAEAHRRSLSYSTWTLLPDGARIHARVSQLDLSRLGLAYLTSGGPDDPVAAYLASRLGMTAGDAACAPTAMPTPREAPEGWAVYVWRVRCPSAEPRAITSELFLDVAPSHMHFARLGAAGEPAGATERVLSEGQPSWPLAAPGERRDESGTSLSGYLALGVEHILTGWDHLAFVLALLLLAGSVGEVAALVTSFTVA